MNHYELMKLVSELGTNLAAAGAETYRIEESICRISVAYGLNAKVYAVPNTLIITIITDGGQPITQLCRVDTHSTDMDSVERFSNLSRRICKHTPNLDTALLWLQEATVQKKTYPLLARLLGCVLVSSGFCIFFGGTWTDGLGAIICGFLLGYALYFLEKFHANSFFQKIAAAFVTAFAAYLLNAIGLGQNVDTIVIGPLMLLVPGLLFTNALRDIIFGDTNSGINRAVEVLLIAAAIALGTAFACHIAIRIYGMPNIAPIVNHSPILTIPISFLACSGFVIVFNVHGKGKVLCALGGALTWFIYCLSSHFSLGSFTSCFLATITATVFSEVMARLRKYPATSYLTISLLPLIPGAGIYYTAQQVVQGNMSGFISYGLNTLATAGTMAVGILIITTIIRLWHRVHQN